MATNAISKAGQAAGQPAYDKSEWFDSSYYKWGILPIFACAAMWVYFQRVFVRSLHFFCCLKVNYSPCR